MKSIFSASAIMILFYVSFKISYNSYWYPIIFIIIGIIIDDLTNSLLSSNSEETEETEEKETEEEKVKVKDLTYDKILNFLQSKEKENVIVESIILSDEEFDQWLYKPTKELIENKSAFILWGYDTKILRENKFPDPERINVKL